MKESEARWAYRNEYTLRKRLSTADLLIVMGWLDETWVDWVFLEAQRLVTQVRGEPTP